MRQSIFTFIVIPLLVPLSAYAYEDSLDIDEMEVRIKTTVERVNAYMMHHGPGNTTWEELSIAYSGYLAEFENIRTIYSVYEDSGDPPDEISELLGILYIAIDAMSDYAKGADSDGMEAMRLSMDAAKKWKEVNDSFGTGL